MNRFASRNFLLRLTFTLAVVIAARSAAATSFWISADQFKQLHVVVGADDPEPEQIAARRFAEHWRLTTGFTPTQSNEAMVGSVNVWIGDAVRRAFPAEFGRRVSSMEGCFILTQANKDRSGGQGDLLIAGGDPRGTLRAEWAFFERFLGARAYAPGVLKFPAPRKGIPSIDWRDEPVFEYRDTNYRAFLNNPWLASLNDLNGQWSAVPERFGGHIAFVRGLAGHGHTFHDFVNPEEYFGAHPEYFAEIEGERVKEAQLCLTNPEVLAITIARAQRLLREAAPNERILSVSQMDYFWFDSWCTCATCRAVDEEEGSQSGTIVRFVNAVAAAIEGEFPDALVDTFAYLYSRKPPRLTRPRDNVLIRLCAIEADYGRPLGDWRSADNRVFVRDLKAWRKIARHLYVWDYTQNWRAFQAPHPNVRVLQPNLELYARFGVDGVFEQASPFSPHSDFEFLKAYLIGRGLREPDFDGKEEAADFIEAYYGEAAPFIEEYQRLLQKRLRAWGGPLYFVNDLEWIDAETVQRAQGIFARAFAATRDEGIAERLRAAYLPVQYAALVCPPRVAQTPEAYVFTRPPSQSLEEYWATMQSLGVTHLNDYPIEQLKNRMENRTPPREEVAPIVKLRNERFEVWVVPARGGAIVRWRERWTGRDWLEGYDDIRSASGRLQDWATSDADRGAEPEALEEQYRVIEQRAAELTIEARLENGLVIRKRIILDGDRLETQYTLTNSAVNPILPKVALVAEFAIEDLERPIVRTLPTDQEVSLRFPSIGRTIAAEVLDGKPGDTVAMHREHGEAIRLEVKLQRQPLAPGESRELLVRHSISEGKPARSPATRAH